MTWKTTYYDSHGYTCEIKGRYHSCEEINRQKPPFKATWFGSTYWICPKCSDSNGEEQKTCTCGYRI